jgi:hypothetical protein
MSALRVIGFLGYRHATGDTIKPIPLRGAIVFEERRI